MSIWTDAYGQDLPPPLLAVKSWAYQLAGADLDELAASNFDLIVVDYSADGGDQRAFSPADVAMLQRRPRGNRRIVLAYLSVGEAEDYRFYWNRRWRRNPPRWLGKENPEWKGNYAVEYWDADWQRLLFGTRGSYLDKIIRAGFDGVYLDVIDAYESMADVRPEAGREMIALVHALSRYAKTQRAEPFYVVAQNGEPLVADPTFLSAIDGIAKEDLFYGHDGAGANTPPSVTREGLALLRRAKVAGKLVLTVDYPSDPTTVAQVYQRSRSEGLVPYCTRRELDRLTVNPQDPPIPLPIRSRAGTRSVPGQFFALVTPKGVWRIGVGAETSTESAIGDSGQPDETRRESMYATTVGVGLGGGWELGVRFPVVRGRLGAQSGDGQQSGGLGNLGLVAARSWQTKDQASNVLASIDAAFPTDSRTEAFRPGPEIRLSSTAEHYWNRLGLLGSVGTTYRAADDWTESSVAGDWSAGVGIQVTGRAFGSIHLGGEQGTMRAEGGAEFLFGRDKSIEVFIGRDLSGPAHAFAAGAGLNLWIDHRRRRPLRGVDTAPMYPID